MRAFCSQYDKQATQNISGEIYLRAGQPQDLAPGSQHKARQLEIAIPFSQQAQPHLQTAQRLVAKRAETPSFSLPKNAETFIIQ